MFYDNSLTARCYTFIFKSSTFPFYKKHINSGLEIEGLLFTMFDSRYNDHKNAVNEVTKAYGSDIRIFNTKIPVSLARTNEAQAKGKSILEHDPRGRVAKAYLEFVKELIPSA